MRLEESVNGFANSLQITRTVLAASATRGRPGRLPAATHSDGRKCLVPNPKLSGNPIVEALCEFVLSGEGVDGTLAGRLHALVQAAYPTVRPQAPQRLQLVADAWANATPPTPPSPVLFFSPDGVRAMRVSGSTVSVHRLNRYDSWEEFAPSILNGYAAIRNVVPRAKIEAVSLRYMNRIRLEVTSTAGLSQWLLLAPGVAFGGPRELRVVGVQMEESSEGNIRGVFLNTVPPRPGGEAQPGLTFVLDIRFSRVGDCDGLQLPAWLENAHNGVFSAFEQCTTPALRERFAQAATEVPS